MSNFKLNLPTDIPWERICVTEDMIDRVVCDSRLPAKWQSSLAVFKYKPEDEYQIYPKYDITYLKVTASITGYQPIDKEIQGRIDWNGVHVSTIQGLTDLLNSYNPCHGAILQVVVGPEDDAKTQLKDYPFFMDFEPKKRELYELATDTNEKSSRSIESLNITKSAGTTQSMEILDIDMGGGGFGMQGSYAGTGGGFSYSAPNGQWGTRRLNAEESLSSRSSDVGQEKRDTFSHTTQLSQMYHLLDSYHVGTNRVVFFIQPRPHTLEEPSGFVRGPRPVDGIQEFFMVVAQPKNQKDFCVSLRLDTSHLTRTPIMEYERKSLISSVVSAAIPTQWQLDDSFYANYRVGDKIVGARACFGDCWDVHYQCYVTQKDATETINAPDGYIIESYGDIINESDHASSDVFISDDGSSATINIRANGQVCVETGEDVCINCDDYINYFFGSARRQIQLNLRSKVPTKQTGVNEALMITTRGLCCCATGARIGKYISDDFVVGIKAIPQDLSVHYYLDSFAKTNESSAIANSKYIAQADTACKECSEKAGNLNIQNPDTKYTMRLANELSNYIKTETIKSLNDPNVKLQKFYETDYFVKQLEYQIVQSKKGRELLNQSATKNIPESAVPKLEKYFKKSVKEITTMDLLGIRANDLTKISGLDYKEVNQIKLSILGIKFSKEEQAKTKRSTSKGKDTSSKKAN